MDNNKDLWEMSKEELIIKKQQFINYFDNISYEPSEDALAQYDILIKLEEVRELVLNKKDRVYFADRHGTYEKLNQIRDIVQGEYLKKDNIIIELENGSVIQSIGNSNDNIRGQRSKLNPID